MRHHNAGRKFGRNTSHRRAMFKNLAANLVTHERIETTDAKAKELRRVAERLFTKAIRLGEVAYTPWDKLSAVDKGKRLHAQRLVAQDLPRFGVKEQDGQHTKIDLVEKIFVDLAKRYAGRQGGYTRIIKLGPRRGDNAPMVYIELVDAQITRALSGAGEAKGAATAAAPSEGGTKAELGLFATCLANARVGSPRSRVSSFQGASHVQEVMRAVLSARRLRASVQRVSVSPARRQIASAAFFIDEKARQAIAHGDCASRAGFASSAFSAGLSGEASAWRCAGEGWTGVDAGGGAAEGGATVGGVATVPAGAGRLPVAAEGCP
jgi:large subunit ribosomal protein L17